MQTIAFTGHLADMPPSLFPEDAVELKDLQPQFEAPLTPAIELASGPAPTGTRTALKIARAISGATELRLLSQKCDDGAELFFIDSVTMAPYKPNVSLLETSKQKPMNKKQAHTEFDRRVAAQYPAETLRNGKTVAIHLNLL
jgi:hypothetical protein